MIDDEEGRSLIERIGEAFANHIGLVVDTGDDDDDDSEPAPLSEEESERATQAFLNEVSLKYPVEFADLYNGFPVCPTEPGLYALVAADDILIRVVSEKISEDEIMDLVRDDIVGRLFKSENARLANQGMTTTEIMVATFPRLVVLKRQYHLDKL